MANWVTIGTTDVTNNRGTVGYAYLQYDSDSTGGSTWPCRAITGTKQGSSFSVNFININIGGVQHANVAATNNGTVFWSADIPGGASISGSWTATWYSQYGGNRDFYISGSVPNKGSAPSGGYVNNLSSTWNSVTGTYGVASNGGHTLDEIILKILKDPYVPGVPAREHEDSGGIGPRTVTITNSSHEFNNPSWTFKGCGLYYTGVYARNAVGEYRYQGPTIYTPPAPGQFSYTDPGGVGPKTYTVNFTGVAANNATDYTPSELTRTVRYKINDGQWVYQQESVQAAITDNTTFSVTIPASFNATVEGWMNYRGNSSESVSVVITNSNSPVDLYGSVNGEATLITKLYGSVNGESVKIEKLYASVDGVARKVFEDV